MLDPGPVHSEEAGEDRAGIALPIHGESVGLDVEIRKLIRQLEDLHRGKLAAEKLAACGEQAVGPLREYLIFGTPSHVFQPRQWAVQVLSRLGAWPVLLEYLSTRKDIPDPVVQFGEEAVQGTAARALAAWKTDEVFETFFRFASEKSLPGVIEALGSFRKAESIPLLIRALGDDLSRGAAESALRLMGPAARSFLEVLVTESVSHPRGESPTERIRRKIARAILVDLERPPEADGDTLGSDGVESG